MKLAGSRSRFDLMGIRLNKLFKIGLKNSILMKLSPSMTEIILFAIDWLPRRKYPPQRAASIIASGSDEEPPSEARTVKGNSIRYAFTAKRWASRL